MRTRRRWYTQLWTWAVLAIVAGVVFGLVALAQAEKAEWLAEAFIQVIKAVTGPVIFVTVIVGIASLGNLRRTGGLAGRALGYFLGMTVVALGLRGAFGGTAFHGGELRRRVAGRPRQAHARLLGDLRVLAFVVFGRAGHAHRRAARARRPDDPHLKGVRASPAPAS